jgi:hypothetical protein
MEKSKLPSKKSPKHVHPYSQNIDMDVRLDKEQNKPSKKKLRKLTEKMYGLDTQPAILPLFQKLYLPKNSEINIPLSDQRQCGQSSEPIRVGAEEADGNVRIMHRKLKENSEHTLQ